MPFLQHELPPGQRLSTPATATGPEIAIVGMGCRLPGDIAAPSQLWDFLAAERSAGGKMPASRFNIDGYHGDPDEPATTRALGGYFLQEDVRLFDNQFFGINNREAADMDPQQRKLLEVVFESLESAGVPLEEVSGANVGCYVASFVADFIALQSKDPESLTRYSQAGMGTTLLANRISHVFNLKGPSCVVDTACSSSFYALHMACAALQQGECDAAVVAGVNLIMSPEMHVSISQAGVISPSSTCHTFDASADGYGRADGVNSVYIKRLSDAMRDGDPIRCIIRGTAVNSNGRTPGVTQPSIDGQEAVARKAYARAGLQPADTAYVETHGTGTAVGDPMEIEALSRVFRRADRVEPILVGGVKPNLGHGEASSGLTSVIKTVLALEHGEIPATIGLSQMNPKIRPGDWGVQVVTQASPFPTLRAGSPRRISINSFGYGGANAHGIFEEAGRCGASLALGTGSDQALPSSTQPSLPYLLPFSANKPAGLESRVRHLRQLNLSAISLPDLAYTLGERRSHLSHRGYIIARRDALEQDLTLENLVAPVIEGGHAGPFAFAFTGQGAQWQGMARELLQFPVFADSIRRLDGDLKRLPYAAPTWCIADVLQDTQADCPVNQAAYAQPLTTAVQIGLVDLLRTWSISPLGVIGHSSGEIAAAYAAGLLTAREAITVAYYRGYAVSQPSSTGAMAAVGLDADATNEWVARVAAHDSVRVACINSPQSTTVSGDADGVDRLVQALQAEGIFVRKLKTDGKAYHSHHMARVGVMYESLLHDMSTFGDDWTPSSEVIHMHSTVDDRLVHAKQVRNPTYWRRNLESPVQFRSGLGDLSRRIEDANWVEIGPHAALKMPILQTLGRTVSYESALMRGQDAASSLLSFAGRLFVHGIPVDFAQIRRSYPLESTNPKMVRDLPPYPWHYDEPLWNESRVSREGRQRKHARHELLGSAIPGGSLTTFGWRNLLRLDNVPWLRDHQLGDEPVFPAAGYIAMAVEALAQTALPGNLDLADFSVVLRHVDLLQALPLHEQEPVELYTELRAQAISNVRDSRDWWEFRIASIADGLSTVRAKGTIKIAVPTESLGMPLPSSSCQLAAQSSRLWYERISKAGFGYGPAFQQMMRLFTADPKGTRYTEAHTPSLSPVLEGSQSAPRYLLHPTLLDNLLQTGLVACTAGHLPAMVARVPTRLEEVWVRRPMHPQDAGIIRCTSDVTGFTTNKLNAALWDARQQPVAHMAGVDIIAYTGHEKMEVRHPLYRMSWKPDIEQIQSSTGLSWAVGYVQSISDLGMLGPYADILSALDLAVHKSPDAPILCMSTDIAMIALAFLEVLEASTAHRRFHSFFLGRFATDGALEVTEITKYTAPLGLKSATYRQADPDDDYKIIILGEDMTPCNKLSSYTDSGSLFLGPAETNQDRLPSSLDNFAVAHAQSHPHRNGVFLLRPSMSKPSSRSAFEQIILVVRTEGDSADERLRGFLAADLGVKVDLISLANMARLSPISPSTLVVSTAELDQPVMTEVTSDCYNAVKQLVMHAPRIVWITGSGAQQDCNPTMSLFPGLARAVMIEQPSTKIFSLELAPNTDREVISLHVAHIAAQSTHRIVEHEFLQSGPGLLISRAIPDDRMNQHFRIRQEETAISTPLATAGAASLSVQKPGQLSTVRFVPTAESNRGILADDEVRVKVSFIGLNAKDVYAMAGRVQTPDACCSAEFTGQVVGVGTAVRELAVGDTVAAMYPGHFGTYETVPARCCVKLETTDDPRVMASVFVVFVTALYAFENRAHLQPGESVLIHSAAGGVGIAAIQLAQMMGAEIFATVGTDEKKQYLVKTFGLRADHIFSSRDTSFAEGIRSVTGGRGVDVVLNSLVGELLHASWGCLAEFGRFVEIGKRDIHDYGKLSMDSFAHATTFTAFDLSRLILSQSPAQHRQYHSMLLRIVALLRSGTIQPILPLTTFNAAELPTALNYFNSTKRMGKIVISFEDPTQMVPVVPERFQTRLHGHKSYLMVGCLGGLGRSLSKWMMHRGARQFVFIGRSGVQRPAARHLVEELERDGARCIVVTGDVVHAEDVERAVAAAPAPLGGVVQAAMGLNEAIFADMPHEFWRNGTQAKVQGTWNLHDALSRLDREKQLDFFLLTSSINGKVGTATEGNYCAANNFLDVFARYRRSLGRTAVSLGLGMISEVGYLHENPHIEDLLLRKGVRPITEDELLQIVDLGLSQPSTSAHADDWIAQSHILTGLELTGLQRQHQHGYGGYWQFLEEARFGVLTGALKRSSGVAAESGNGRQASPITAALAAGDEDQLIDAAQTVIAQKMSSLILLPLDKLNVQTAVADFGMDSMLAAELRQFVFAATGADVPFLALMDKKTSISSLARTVARQLLHHDESQPTAKGN
ncbi:putative polyketide synthase [Aspergillus steynii IBT 23096]|uniref:Putative polyketide synthase n=1 Tax=Aspergillus steynii IBT 23096 TaxID=1392250 RepID=A0A2I2G3F9_9EURO|nr:putative polyketide synthase [Aspergillus steynii IBT 23096]PLB47412.1 putative polyketide synthase [Aspergillus steynii IBT 23096]